MSFSKNDYSLEELHKQLDHHIKIFKDGVPLTDQLLDSYLTIKKQIKKLEDSIIEKDLSPAEKFKRQWLE